MLKSLFSISIFLLVNSFGDNHNINEDRKQGSNILTMVKKQQNNYAFIIGISNYDNRWASLPSSFEDAKKMTSYLFDIAKYDRVVTLTNSEASKHRITKYMEEEFPNALKKGDRFVFYFSGHGTQRELSNNRKRGYLVMQSSGKNTWSDMISMDDINRWNENLQHIQQVLFILDCCCSKTYGFHKCVLTR